MPVKPKKIPMRMCVGCRQMKPKKELLRVVRSPEGEVSLDPAGKNARPGRVLLLQRRLSKAGAETGPAGSPAGGEAGPGGQSEPDRDHESSAGGKQGMNETAEERALSFLGLCMRAGQVVSGQEACVAAIRGGECALALLDAGASRKHAQAGGGRACASHQVPLYRISPGALGHANRQARTDGDLRPRRANGR